MWQAVFFKLVMGDLLELKAGKEGCSIDIPAQAA